MKKFFLLGSTAFFCSTAFSQTLFTYGTNAVSKTEFLKAYNKNKTDAADGEKALSEYLDLYAKFKLKVKAAKDMRLDTLQQLKLDLDNFKTQVAETYMNNEVYLNTLIDEAAANTKKDVQVMHFFIAANDKTTKDDSIKAAKGIQELYSRLQGGDVNYTNITADISAAFLPAKATNIGYITAFTLPYDYEKLIFNLKPGGVSTPYHSQKGWHVFKVLNQRPNPGKWRAAQILLAVAPDKSNAAEQSNKADSLYSLLKAGADFAELAKQYSNDKITYMAGGELQEFTTGRFEADFENEVFKLNTDGEFTKPFLTAYGYHIVKRLSVKPTPADIKDAAFRYEIKQKVMQDSRFNLAKEMFNQEVLKKVVFTRNNSVKDAEIFSWADSAGKNPAAVLDKKNAFSGKTLFTLGKNILNGAEWLRFIVDYKANPEIYHGENNTTLLKKFVTVKSLEYYKAHLEKFSPEFKNQIDEFKEGNLLFEVMERKVWSTAANDNAGLKKYYEQNKSKYVWAASADVIVFNCGNKKTAEDAYKALKEGKSWKAIAEANNSVIQADSGRYELAQIILPPNTSPAMGLLTPVNVNEADGSAGFIKIIMLHNAGEPRSFEEARGLVVNDYQNLLEENWITELRKKYPIKINDTVFKSLFK